jgi:hypothetical protein
MLSALADDIKSDVKGSGNVVSLEDTEDKNDGSNDKDPNRNDSDSNEKTPNKAENDVKNGNTFADCMEFRFGCEKDDDPIIAYVVPSCLHCVMFLVEDLDKFLKKYGQLHGVVVRFIVPTKRDLFIIKLFYNKFLNYKWKDRQQDYQTNKYKMYWQYVDYVKRIIATAKSKHDPGLEELKRVALDFKFSEKDLELADPNQKGRFEKEIIAKSADYTGYITQISKSNEIKTPYITQGDEELDTLEEATDIDDTESNADNDDIKK